MMLPVSLLLLLGIPVSWGTVKRRDWVMLLVLGFFCLAIVPCNGLDCDDCPLSVLGQCHASRVTCQVGQSCYIGFGVAIDGQRIELKGCLADDKCGTTETKMFPEGDINSRSYKVNIMRMCYGEYNTNVFDTFWNKNKQQCPSITRSGTDQSSSNMPIPSILLFTLLTIMLFYVLM